ncbi:glutamate racemase [Mariniflexile ostreae]|uniref:Glutamate racemase n=1 Tax=Mariniflexile ostreae TaxID=1520892 RepID=A0ABV5F9S8_9FLAO
MNTQPIGIFDSGVGGTSLWKEIFALLPHENTIYLADSANAPYGSKSKNEILQLSIKNTEYLLNKNCKLIVVACNTATTNAIDILRSQYKVPFIGIEPAIKPAALNSKTKAIGILATKGTLSSELFHNTSTLYTQGHRVVERIGEGLVELIEAGKANDPLTKALLKTYLDPMIAANIDYLVLGCTHYPYLMPLLLELLPEQVKIIDSGLAVAKQTKVVLDQYDVLNAQNTPSENQFFTNGNPEVMKDLLGGAFNVDVLDF